MNSPRIWPIPQELRLRDDVLPLHRAALVVPAQARPADLAPAQLFADFVADDFGLVVPIARGAAPAGRVPIEIRIAGRPGAGRAPRELPGAEGYLLTVSAAGARLFGRDVRGAQHAVATLLQLAERRDRDVVVRGAEVRDWPYKPVRMVHLYLPGPDHLDYARRYLRDFLVRYKYNGLFIEMGGGVRLRNRPEIPVAWRRFVEETYAIGETSALYGMNRPLGPGRRFPDSIHTHLADGRYLEPQDARRLFDWTREYHLDAIPEIQSLTHSYYLAAAFPEIAELPEAAFPDAYCPSNPRSRQLLFEVMAELISLTGCHAVHIGRDEWRAGGLCPICRTKDTGELFAQDVIEIARWLAERGQNVWMWGDHLVPKHTATGSTHDDGTILWDYPQTKQAAALIGASGIKLNILNWSWALGSASEIDQVFIDLGFPQIYGNFDGRRFEHWPERSANPGVLGVGVSSWCAWNDFELGMLHYPAALHAANLVWSSHYPEPREGNETLALESPRLRDRMRRSWEGPRLWSLATGPQRKHVISIATACNAPLHSDEYDLRGLRLGRQEYDGLPYEFVDPARNNGLGAIVVSRLPLPPESGTDAGYTLSWEDGAIPQVQSHGSAESALQPAAATRAEEHPHSSAPIPIGRACGSLIFWQTASSKGTEPPHVGDGTNFPHDAAELLGWYEIRYADGLTRTAEVRYHENVGAWDEGHKLLYHARELPAGTLPDGRPLIIWGLEWTNPRPHVPIESVTLHGTRPLPYLRPNRRVSEARPMLLGITAVELPQWIDLRPEWEGKLPGWER